MESNSGVLLPAMSFHVTEAYKTLRTNLLFTLAAGENKAVVISSPLQSEGKSVTCANLATAMAQTDAKVIILDADMRKPSQHKVFKISNIEGLSSILGGFSEVSKMIRKDIQPNLDIITSGPIPPNPSELLESPRMLDLIILLGEYYDYVFIDSPPINIVSDAVILAKKAAGLVLVTRHRQSTYSDLTKAVSKLSFADANILGIVVNAIKEQGGLYGKYKYRYKYGDDL